MLLSLFDWVKYRWKKRAICRLAVVTDGKTREIQVARAFVIGSYGWVIHSGYPRHSPGGGYDYAQRWGTCG